MRHSHPLFGRGRGGFEDRQVRVSPRAEFGARRGKTVDGLHRLVSGGGRSELEERKVLTFDAWCLRGRNGRSSKSDRCSRLPLRTSGARFASGRAGEPRELDCNAVVATGRSPSANLGSSTELRTHALVSPWAKTSGSSPLSRGLPWRTFGSSSHANSGRLSLRTLGELDCNRGLGSLIEPIAWMRSPSANLGSSNCDSFRRGTVSSLPLRTWGARLQPGHHPRDSAVRRDVSLCEPRELDCNAYPTRVGRVHSTTSPSANFGSSIATLRRTCAESPSANLGRLDCKPGTAAAFAATIPRVSLCEPRELDCNPESR